MPFVKLCCAMLVFFLSGCVHATPSLQERFGVMMALGREGGLEPLVISTQHFELFSLQTLLTCKDQPMRVYIEGDGLSWKTRSLVSDDPTPLFPTTLSLMAQDAFTCKVYLARPCQYTRGKNCEEKYWTSHRFSEEVILSYTQALEQLKYTHHTSHFELVGYSGGGAIAALVASRREDVKRLMTIAGNMDTQAWTTLHHIDALKGSLNPANVTLRLEGIEQYHLIGKDDTVVPNSIFFSYLSHFKNRDKISYNFYKASHTCCWESVYKTFIQGVPPYER